MGLGRTDFKGDEPIYSFAVDAMLKSGDWLTPRSIPDENAAFLEKPPLKFWIIAGSIRSGLLPHNEFGQRFWDAAFGAVSFLYVFAFGARIGGPLCGVIAVFALFVHRPLLYEHGVRSNNMEAPLLLAYCGGIYHALAWSSAIAQRARLLHPQAVGAFFVLGFMTKFVAVVFLPFILVVTALLFPHWRRRAVDDWRAWAVATLLVVAASAPWFLYETVQHGRVFWDVLLGEHVYKRMTAFLDPSHLKPWHYYFTTLYRETLANGTAIAIVLGMGLLAFRTIRERWDAGVLILLWFAVPFAAISVGSSKLYHYTYPFLPPLALAAGYLPAALLSRDSRVRQAFENAGERVARLPRLQALRHRVPVLRRAVMAIAVLAFVVAVVTIVYGRFGIRIGDLLLFRNASIMRPLVAGIILLALAGWGRLAGRTVMIATLLAMLPSGAYRATLEKLTENDEPMQVLRDCLGTWMPPGDRPGVFVHTADPGQWRYVYYFRDLGWEQPSEHDDRQLIAPLFLPAQQRPVLLGVDDYARFERALAAGRMEGAETGGPQSAEMLGQLSRMTNIRFDDHRMLLLPGRYAACGPATIAAPKG